MRRLRGFLDVRLANPAERALCDIAHNAMEGYARSRTDKSDGTVHSSAMGTPEDPRILATERLNDGVIVQFADGRCVFYSASLLYAMIEEAQEQDETQLEW
jgi:hypothetical protein